MCLVSVDKIFPSPFFFNKKKMNLPFLLFG